jgi:hypothetical protein
MNLSQGMSLPFLARLAEEMQKRAMLDKPLRQFQEAFIMPLTDRPGYTSLGDVWIAQDLRDATTFVSYAVKYSTAGQLLEDMTKYLAEHDSEHLWWFCITCSLHSQHWEALSSDSTILFRRVIERLPKFVLMLSSWSKPLELSRLWVLYELWCAVRAGCEITVLTSSSEGSAPKDSEATIKAIKDRVNIARAFCNCSEDRAERALRRAFAEDGEKQVEDAIVVALVDAYLESLNVTRADQPDPAPAAFGGDEQA